MDRIRQWHPPSHVNEEGDGSDIDPSELTYSLEIVQQPKRARMCGFGDKDRRNITPAPVLKLVAKSAGGQVITASRLNKQAFVVNADLWLEDEVTERNIVLISSISQTKTPSKLPSSSSSDVSSSGGNSASRTGEGDGIEGASPPQTPNAQPTAPLTPMTPSQADRFDHQSLDLQDDRWKAFNDRFGGDQSDQRQMTNSKGHDEEDEMDDGIDDEDINWDNMTTQNLVGQTTVGGQNAPDLDGKMSHIWFAFSVLSIRTEGIFKLRFSLFDLTQLDPEYTTSAPVVYRLFSDPIHVQSPKRFLGTCDNNEIANHLNKYSIRIPSRKDEKPFKGQNA